MFGFDWGWGFGVCCGVIWLFFGVFGCFSGFFVVFWGFLLFLVCGVGFVAGKELTMFMDLSKRNQNHETKQNLSSREDSITVID